ncbi:NACHT domain-containing protein [Hirsutella rhossiliensis]|uniref:NACHT domain-containing protein n=1 Tax=Hirsutella rhossiliensis TaxID=111463 RepID=A0A9P8SEH8_9HYPO|nr:NACHT domain-containing protein [Hirsutella rhossiliensis]KAH0959686.1 NACHT domain-containing protein [Hirsutella rhossiliensis]
MEPLFALVVASEVFDFTDFGGELISRSFVVRESDQPPKVEVVRLTDTINTLRAVASEVLSKIDSLRLSYRTHSDSIDHLYTECGRYDAKEARERMQSTDEGADHVTDIVSRVQVTMNALKGDFKSISERKPLGDEGWERIDDALWAVTGLVDISCDIPSQYPDPPSSSTSSSRPRQHQLREKILRSLAFGGMAERSKKIPTAYPDTFGWLFHAEGGCEPGNGQSMNFMQWLGSQTEDIFWITGKPASGKSTLMKYISTHKDLRPYLEEWAGSSALLTAKFYFWGPGSKIQKSRIGLLRSLLYQLLEQRPDLCELVAPRRRIFFDLAGDKAESPDWNWVELQKCLLRFGSHTRNRARLALFVDGLDEYDKYDGTTQDLIALLKQMHQDYNLKLCVSSRPWNEFEDAFGSSPSLKMENLTANDIETYINSRFNESRALRNLSKIVSGDVQYLKTEMRQRANGVFLWVVLVMERLIKTAQGTPLFGEIWEVFNQLPRDLNELYERIMSTVDAAKKKTASRLYQLVMEWKRNWSGQIDAILLWLAVGCQDPTKQLLYPAMQGHAFIPGMVKRLLEEHTKGILQVSGSPTQTVDFLHRTAFDWLKEKDNWEKICSQQPSGFQSCLTLIATLVGHLRSLEEVSNDTTTRREHRRQCVFRILKFSRGVTNTAENRRQLAAILDQLELEGLLPPLDVDTIFHKTQFSRKSRLVQNGFLALAASWSCLPFLQGKCDGSPEVLHSKDQEAFKYVLSGGPRPVSLLEAAVFGAVPRVISRRYTSWLDEVRGFSKWQVSMRVDTVKFLVEKCYLEKNKKPPKDVKEHVKQFKENTKLGEGDFENHYWTLVAMMFGGLSTSASFNQEKRRLLPDIEESRFVEEFPQFEITPTQSRQPDATLRPWPSNSYWR